MNILVTGANGFIGKKLTKALIEHGHNVTPHTHQDGDLSKVKLNYQNIEHVIHLAGKIFVPESWKNPTDFYSINVMGTQNILEFCRHQSASLTYLSSYVYGTPKTLPVSEEHTEKANNPYNHSKFLAEQVCRFYAEEFKVNIKVLRPFNIYGPGQKEDFLIPLIINQLIDTEVKTIEVANLIPKRDFLYIDDFVKAIILCLTKTDNNYSLYNVGYGESFSVESIIKAALKVSGIKKEYRSKNDIRSNEILDVAADIGKIKKELNWQPETTLEAGLENIIRELK